MQYKRFAVAPSPQPLNPNAPEFVWNPHGQYSPERPSSELRFKHLHVESLKKLNAEFEKNIEITHAKSQMLRQLLQSLSGELARTFPLLRISCYIGGSTPPYILGEGPGIKPNDLDFIVVFNRDQRFSAEEIDRIQSCLNKAIFPNTHRVDYQNDYHMRASWSSDDSDTGYTHALYNIGPLEFKFLINLNSRNFVFTRDSLLIDIETNAWVVQKDAPSLSTVFDHIREGVLSCPKPENIRELFWRLLHAFDRHPEFKLLDPEAVFGVIARKPPTANELALKVRLCSPVQQSYFFCLAVQLIDRFRPNDSALAPLKADLSSKIGISQPLPQPLEQEPIPDAAPIEKDPKKKASTTPKIQPIWKKKDPELLRAYLRENKPNLDSCRSCLCGDPWKEGFDLLIEYNVYSLRTLHTLLEVTPSEKNTLIIVYLHAQLTEHPDIRNDFRVLPGFIKKLKQIPEALSIVELLTPPEVAPVPPPPKAPKEPPEANPTGKDKKSASAPKTSKAVAQKGEDAAFEKMIAKERELNAKATAKGPGVDSVSASRKFSMKDLRRLPNEFKDLMKDPRFETFRPWFLANHDFLQKYPMSNELVRLPWMQAIMFFGGTHEGILALVTNLFQDPQTRPFALAVINTPDESENVPPINFAALHHQYEMVNLFIDQGAKLTLVCIKNLHLIHLLASADKDCIANYGAAIEKKIAEIAEKVLVRLTPDELTALRALNSSDSAQLSPFDYALLYEIKSLYALFVRFQIPLGLNGPPLVMEQIDNPEIIAILTALRAAPYQLDFG